MKFTQDPDWIEIVTAVVTLIVIASVVWGLLA